jgi:hypothetical protein
MVGNSIMQVAKTVKSIKEEKATRKEAQKKLKHVA